MVFEEADEPRAEVYLDKSQGLSGRQIDNEMRAVGTHDGYCIDDISEIEDQLMNDLCDKAKKLWEESQNG